MKTTRMLSVTLTEAELTERRDKLAKADQEKLAILAEKRSALAGFRARLKPIDESIDMISREIVTRSQVREVECEERPGLVNGVIEVVRLDTGEVVETIHPDEDARQASLFESPRPTLPELRCTAVDEDGDCFAITAEQADAAEREIAERGKARLEIRGEDGWGVVFAVRIVRGRACDTCGIVAPHHRPECPGTKAEDAEDGDDGPEDHAEASRLLAEIQALAPMVASQAMPVTRIADAAGDDDYDRNDTAEVARKIAEVAPPDDRPLAARGVESATARPKRRRRAQAEGKVQS